MANPDHYYQLKQMVQCKEQEGSEAEVWLDLWTDTAPDSKTEDEDDKLKEEKDHGKAQKEAEKQDTESRTGKNMK